MAKLHLLPVPDAKILPFPIQARNGTDAVVGQMANLESHMAAQSGGYLGRIFFLEAAVYQIARSAERAGGVAEARAMMLEEFDNIVAGVSIGSGFASCDPSGPGAA